MVIVTRRDNKDHIWFLLYSHYNYHCYRVAGPPKLDSIN